jgi:type I restriction enzyme S subunit
MIQDLKPYSQYKDSGLPWLGEVPSHWETARSKRLFRQRKEFAQPDDQQLSATQAFGVIPQALYEQLTGYRVVKISMHLDKRKHVEADDFVISMRSFQGGLERAWAAGAIRSSYVVLEPSTEVSAGYFQHLFKSHQYINALRATSDFIRDGQDLNFGNFCGVDLPLIPLQEQAAIARFLAWATNRLDRAIGAKRKIIALLQVQKQAIIHRAVTRGLDPSVPLKDSGIPWLGEIPEHWEVWRLRHLISERLSYGANAAAEFTNQDWPRYIRITDFCADGSLKSETFRSLPPAVAAGYMVKPGDILFARSGATVGKAFLVMALTGGACHAGYLIRARPDQRRIHPEYLFAFTQSIAFSSWKDSTFNTATIQNIGADKYANLLTPMPSLPEQLAILKSLITEHRPILAAISRLEREITLLREYRTRLIADVVTGKLDVRELAAGLPKEDLQDQPDVAAEYDTDEAEDDAESDLIDTAED